ncbi:hypothetical protein ACFCXP_11320 [Streptomyces niveus]|uniref:hypothetical protein n=1 Tax=Streptomyces niveus TaxID=193462 RepID=UPI0035DFCA42
MRRDVQLGIITETLNKIIPGAVPGNVSARITEHLPNGGVNGWSGSTDALAELVFTGLYGRPAEPGITPLAAITEVLRRPFETVAAADLITGTDIRHVDPSIPRGSSGLPDPWAVQVDVLARRIHDRLFGTPGTTTAGASPLAQAEEAKRRRDLGGEIGALTHGERALKSTRWYPSAPGDLVHVHYEAAGPGLPAWGETYEVIPDPQFSDDLRLRLVHHTAKGDAATMTGAWATEHGEPDPLFDMWFEAGPGQMTIVRDGRVVHPGPAIPGA